MPGAAVNGGEGTRRPLGPGDRAVVTGAGGFIGSAVVRALLARGAEVVAMLAPSGDDANLRDLPVQTVRVDVRDPRGVADALRGARAVFHLAAVYRFWAPDPAVFYAVNVGGTRNVIEAAVDAGAERVVYTGTVGTVGLPGPGASRAADEREYVEIAHLFGLYKQSKYVAEHEALRAAAQGAPVTLVLPTFPLGPGDRKPTPTGKVVVDFLNGRIPGFVDTAMNVAHVDDLAMAHVLAFERGRIGHSYIVGGENLSMRQLLELLAECTGLPPVDRRIPGPLGIAAGWISHLVEGRLLRREPAVPLEGARMSATRMVFDDSRARAELGHCSRPAIDAVESSARWYVEHGYVRPSRSARIRWREPAGRRSG